MQRSASRRSEQSRINNNKSTKRVSSWRSIELSLSDTRIFPQIARFFQHSARYRCPLLLESPGRNEERRSQRSRPFPRWCRASFIQRRTKYWTKGHPHKKRTSFMDNYGAAGLSTVRGQIDRSTGGYEKSGQERISSERMCQLNFYDSQQRFRSSLRICMWSITGLKLKFAWEIRASVADCSR